jgi:hypothetical protein
MRAGPAGGRVLAEENMHKRGIITALLLVCALLVAAPLRADSGKKKDHGNPHASRMFDDHDRDEHGRRGDRDDDRWQRHGNYEVRVYEVREVRPPGWRRGEKTGWGNCGLPPGQAKKYGCRTYVYQERRYFYYTDDVGRVIVRRPHISINVNVH